MTAAPLRSLAAGARRGGRPGRLAQAPACPRPSDCPSCPGSLLATLASLISGALTPTHTPSGAFVLGPLGTVGLTPGSVSAALESEHETPTQTPRTVEQNHTR